MLDQKTINCLKGLVIDSVHQANSGHPGGAMSSMDYAYVLFTEFLEFAPKDPQWQSRDRFILSAGHESMLLYSMLYGIGWLKQEDLSQFRQLGSKTPGHPENILTPGVECTTGPLGQGAAMSVGFAIAEQHLQAQFGSESIDNFTYSLVGDGCVQEGVTLGAASLAGHLKLGKLIWYYDKNNCQISGSLSDVSNDNFSQIFQGFGWHVLEIDGHDRDAIRTAIQAGQKESSRPTLIIGETIMAQGAFSQEGSHKTHGAPLAKEERNKTKEKLGIPQGEEWYWPKDVQEHFQRRFEGLSRRHEEWTKALAQSQQSADFLDKWDSYFNDKSKKTPDFEWSDASLATRSSFGKILAHWGRTQPQVIGGSADLGPSNMTDWFKDLVGEFGPNNSLGRHVSFGVREFPMACVANGLSLYGGLKPFTATFLSFADYSRPAIRLGAIQHAPVIHELTHDSFYLGEDGPTHQPVEQLMSLRLIPHVYDMRPADSIETEVLMNLALSLSFPSCFCLTRQKLPLLPLTRTQVNECVRGAYIVEEGQKLELIIFASGSEVHLAKETSALLKQQYEFLKDGIRIVSIPSFQLFFEQDQAYQNSILAPQCTHRVSIEAGVTLGWERFVGIDGLKVGFDQFGDSAPAQDLAEKYGFTAEKIAEKIRQKYL